MSLNKYTSIPIFLIKVCIHTLYIHTKVYMYTSDKVTGQTNVRIYVYIYTQAANPLNNIIGFHVRELSGQEFFFNSCIYLQINTTPV